MMTADHWFLVGQFIAGAVIGVIVFYWGLSRKQQADAIEERFQRIERDVSHRFDQASHESSKLTGRVQELIGRVDRLPDDLRQKFVPWEVFDRRRTGRTK